MISTDFTPPSSPFSWEKTFQFLEDLDPSADPNTSDFADPPPSYVEYSLGAEQPTAPIEFEVNPLSSGQNQPNSLASLSDVNYTEYHLEELKECVAHSVNTPQIEARIFTIVTELLQDKKMDEAQQLKTKVQIDREVKRHLNDIKNLRFSPHFTEAMIREMLQRNSAPLGKKLRARTEWMPAR